MPELWASGDPQHNFATEPSRAPMMVLSESGAAGVGLANCVISFFLEVFRSTKDTPPLAAARSHRIFT